MAVSPAALWGPTQLGTSYTALYTAPAGINAALVKRAVFSNTSASAVTITVNVVRSGSTALTANQVITTYSIAPDSTYTAPELANLVLKPGDAVYALASAATSVNTVGSGFTL